ncbi:MAG: TonB-dependent receptor, partial [bacterium]|nr:TonB-dependent receptor [bacterium]
EVIDQFRADGLNIFYSSELVTEDLVVVAQPTSVDQARMLDEILAPHGLTTRPGPEGSFIVVRMSAGPRVGILRGQVVSAADGSPLSGASIHLNDAETGTATDAEGKFELKNVPTGKYRVSVAREGFRTQVLPRISIRSDRATEVSFRLPSDSVFLNEIVVTPSAYSVKSHVPEPRQFLNKDEVDRIPHFSDDIFRLMPRLPGTVNADAYATFSVRGGFEDETLVLLDGMQLYEPFHFTEVVAAFSAVDSEAVGNVNLLTGGFTAEFGDRMGGVLEIGSLTSHGPATTLVGASLITLKALSHGQLRNGKGHWLVSARRGYLDWIMNAMGESGPEGEFPSGPTYYDLFAKVSHTLGSRHLATASVFAASDRMVFDGDMDDDWFDTSSGNGYFWVTLDSDWSSQLYSRTMLSAGLVESRFFGQVVAGDSWETEFDSDRSMNVFAFKQDWTWSPSDNLFLKAGFEGRQLKADYDFTMDGVFQNPIDAAQNGSPQYVNRRTVMTVNGTQLSTYAASRFHLGAGLTAEAGLRFDGQDWTNDDDQISPRLNVVWDLGEGGVLRAGWGSYAQSQGPHELQVEDGVTEFFPAQIAEHRVLSYERPFGGGTWLRIDAYSKVVNDVRPYFENLVDTMELFPPGAVDRVRVDPSAFRAHGLEVLFKRNSTDRINWWLSYVYSRAEDELDDEWVPRTRDQRHAVSFSMNWRPGKAWELGFAGIFHTGWARTPIGGELVLGEDGSTYIRPVAGERNSVLIPDYSRFDLRASRTFNLKNSTLRFFVEIMNIFNTENPRSYDYEFTANPDGGVDSTAIVQGTWMPLIPSFGVVWEF